MRRVSPSSQLVLVVVMAALILSAWAGAARSRTLNGTADSSGSAPFATPLLSPTPSPTAPTGASSFEPSSAPTSLPSAPAGSLTLAQLLARLATAPEQRTGYDRSLFVHWIDADGDGCDTRREVLIDESLSKVTIGTSCSISGGSWLSLYDGLFFTDPSLLDIDHMVPLAEAWDSGAFGWNADRRKRFANDLDVSWSLIAVSASSNRSKGDQDPAEWLPPAASEFCSYLGDWLAVKVRWSLSVDSGERAAISTDITSCPDARRPVVLAP
jgi:hypothetical protein